MIRYFIFILTCLMVSCGEPEVKKKEPIPKDILSEKVLAETLADIYLIDAAASIKRLGPVPTRINVPKLYENVYWKHGTNKAQFEKTLDYYSSRPQELNEVYTNALSILSELQAKESSRKE